MADIVFTFPIWASPERVFQAVSEPSQLDEWWSLKFSGRPILGEMYHLGFGPGYDWTAEVTACEAASTFELRLVDADTDWTDTVVRFGLSPREGGTSVTFTHGGWKNPNERYTTSSYCWAMYLRIMKRFIEHEERVAYENRLEV